MELSTTSADYVNRTRIANACRLLLCSDKNIREISEVVGFKSQYYFTRNFKKEIGLTPTEYKKRNLTA
jgi:AraC-like DNA-binding protein